MSNLKRLIGLKGAHETSVDLVDYQMAKSISDKTIFPADSNEMYYFVREGFQESNISEGFCEHM